MMMVVVVEMIDGCYYAFASAPFQLPLNFETGVTYVIQQLFMYIQWRTVWQLWACTSVYQVRNSKAFRMTSKEHYERTHFFCSPQQYTHTTSSHNCRYCWPNFVQILPFSLKHHDSIIQS